MNSSPDSSEPWNESIDRLLRDVRSRLSPENAQRAGLLARSYLRTLPRQGLYEVEARSLAGACEALLDLASERRPGQPVVRIFEPHGQDRPWESSHTSIAIVTDDMPFLVDSISGELVRRELNIHEVLHPQVAVRRDDEGRFMEIVGGRTAGKRGEEGVIAESFMLFEVDAQSAPPALIDLETAILEVLADVRAAVEDWRQMRHISRQFGTDLERNPPPSGAAEIAETKAFLSWIDDDHFTFLGFREYRLVEEGEALFLRSEGRGLGLWRRLPLDERATEKTPLEGAATHFLADERLVAIVKSIHRSTVHRPVHMDILTLKRFRDGKLVGLYRFLGLFTSTAYSIRASRIPLIRRKVDRVLERAAFLPASHNSKAFRHIVETYPRDELFQISADDLFQFALRILDLHLRPRLALLVRRDEEERFLSCTVFVPRDRHSTHLRGRIGKILEGIFRGEVIADSSSITDSPPLARVNLLVRVSPGEVPEYDVTAIERRLTHASRTWSDHLQSALIEAYREERGLSIWRRFGEAFAVGYTERVAPEDAVTDMPLIERVLEHGEFEMRLYRTAGAANSRLHVRIFELAVPTPLSRVLPRLEYMGLTVINETPFEVRPEGASNPVWIRDFELLTDGYEVDLEARRMHFKAAFRRVWNGVVENDPFNRLVLRAGLDWRQAMLLRAYAKYLRQLGSAFSLRYLAQTLAGHADLVRLLIELFAACFDPEQPEDDRDGVRAALDERILDALDAVKSPDADRILRSYWNLVSSTSRTNYYQTSHGEPKPYLALKFDAAKIGAMPPPRPRYEIFVYSPEVEAVHLRGGAVARGGIRWSDRLEDFRTEVLGLVKAQMVKNAVIVPVGAKGGFVVKRPPASGQREEILAHGVECYKTMIRALLDVTDNLDGERMVPPPRVVRRDGDDHYLVVAADKGTASFSDIANQVAAEYDFWLGDAFASGGSKGYDHKKMAITARGAWESVKGHFRELGKDVQTEEFTVVGVGDMSGDVFGNGMLLSQHIRLLAAFNHLHIFIDPDPDPARSFAERRRLFQLSRSTWMDYDRGALSAGGGVYERHAKKIILGGEARQLLGLEDRPHEPEEVIRAILRAPVELLWFGGIGTYVKASHQTDAQADDHTNDEVRVDASQLRAKVIGEGANLALTQAGRVEYAALGGKINTDFIDNSGGVDCSDHEVNIKIALAEAVRSGDLDTAGRDALLAEMSDEVADLVLRDNYLQAKSITLVEARGGELLEEQARLMRDLERAGQLHRRLEGLPDDAALAERRKARLGLTRPEIAVLLASTKIYVHNQLLRSDLPDDPQRIDDLARYFPRPMRQRFGGHIERHRLRREIIATDITNSILNRVGPTFLPRMAKETGSPVAEIARAYTAARDIFDLRGLWSEIEALDNRIPAAAQIAMTLDSVKLLERATRWLLRHVGQKLDLATFLERYRPHIVAVARRLEEMLPTAELERLEEARGQLASTGVPAELARRVALLEVLHSACDVARCAVMAEAGVERVGNVYFAVGESFGFARLFAQARQFRGSSPWIQEAVGTTVQDLFAHQAELTRQIVAIGEGEPTNLIDAWNEERPDARARLDELLRDLEAAGKANFAMLTLVARELRRLAEL